jgi:ABC-type glycerol-3-phosphate transport system substrate-binding protein
MTLIPIRRIGTALVIGALPMLALAAGKPVAATTAKAPAHAALPQEIWHTLKGSAAQTFADIIDSYNRQHADAPVALRAFANPDEMREQLRAKAGTSDAPQWVQWAGGSPDNLYSQFKPNSFEIVQDFLTSGSAGASQASAAATAAFRNSKGKWVALPLTAAIPVVMYRADAFEKAGLPLVNQFSDWKDLQNAAWRLRETGSTCGIASPNPSWVHIENMSGWHSQPVTTQNDGEEGRSGQYTFNALPQVRHMALIMSWVKSDLVFQGSSEQAMQAWVSGKCPILLGASTALGELPEAVRQKVVVTQMPLWSEVSSTQGKLFPNGDGLYLVRPVSKEQKASAASFANHWFKPDVAALWHQKTGAVPLTQEAQAVSRKSGFYERIPGWGVMSEKLAAVKSALVKPFWFAKRQDVLNAGDKEIHGAFDSGKAAKAVLDDSVKAANTLTALTDTAATDRTAKAKK